MVTASKPTAAGNKALFTGSVLVTAVWIFRVWV